MKTMSAKTPLATMLILVALMANSWPVGAQTVWDGNVSQRLRATPHYVCPEGAVVSGTNCIRTVTIPATPTYHCAEGERLVGTSCIGTTSNTITATPHYVCPTGTVLAGTQCVPGHVPQYDAQ